MNEVLAFDWGTAIIGVLNVSTGIYTAYHGPAKMIEGAKRVLYAEGSIVSFNGSACDLPKLFELLSLNETEHVIKATHYDMLIITSNLRWPPDSGTSAINGPGLAGTYAHYFGDDELTPPEGVADKYEANNWRDCYMTAALWTKWVRGELAQ